jgi:nucleotide-binding universal stress UspA family protein
MLKALLPVDGSDTSVRAVKHVVRLIGARGPMQVFLLNVQEPVEAIEVRSHMLEEEIKRWQLTRGEQQLESAKALLGEAGIPYEARVVIGDVGQTIVDVSNEEGCDKIVMGIRGVEAIPGLLLGAVARKVIHLADVPVTLVK